MRPQQNAKVHLLVGPEAEFLIEMDIWRDVSSQFQYIIYKGKLSIEENVFLHKFQI